MRIAGRQAGPPARAQAQLRHVAAQAGVDSTVIALPLGHADVRSTQPYIHADMTIKERALALVTPATVAPGRYTPSDKVLAYLDRLGMTMPTTSLRATPRGRPRSGRQGRPEDRVGIVTRSA